MVEQIVVQEMLIKGLAERKLRNPSYSMRSFARQLKISPSTVSEIIGGKRRVSLTHALNLAQQLALPPKEHHRIKELFKGTSFLSKDIKQEQNKTYQKLQADQFSAIADWQHFAILSLAETDDFKSNPEWIAKRLGISVALANQSLHRLERLAVRA